MTSGETIALTKQTFVGKVMSLLFNMLSRLVITFLPRSKHLLISWLQSPSAVILEPPKKVSYWYAVVHDIPKSRTQLKDWTTMIIFLTFNFILLLVYNIICFKCAILYFDTCIHDSVLTSQGLFSTRYHTIDAFYPFFCHSPLPPP